jgi:Cytochrome P460
MLVDRTALQLIDSVTLTGADSSIQAYGDSSSCTREETPMLHASARSLKLCSALASCALVTVCILYFAKSAAQNQTTGQPQPGRAVHSSNASPIYGVTIPPGYRDWKLIAVDQLLAGNADQLRAQLGNEIAIKAFKEGTLPFPDGTIIAAMHWSRVPSQDNDKVLAGPFPGAQSFVIGSAVNVQFMVKDSKKYAATGGWGFADFKNGKPGDEELHKACFPCHEPAKAHDFVFAHYAPTP